MELEQVASVERPGPLAAEVAHAVDELADRDAVVRLWARDHTLWQDDPTEVADRLGWLDATQLPLHELDELELFAREVADDGVTDVILVGMGGSSLFAEVLARTFGPAPGHPQLHVLDSTDPAAVTRTTAVAPPERLLVLAASKSGTTIETRSHLAHLWEEVGADGAAFRFAVITDPGSMLGEYAQARGFRAVFEGDPDVGGRYSALTRFGTVPAALLGVDLEALFARAVAMTRACAAEVEVRRNPGARLGAWMAAGVRAGRDKLTLLTSEQAAPFGVWVEQLVAESTGKAGTGVLPVVGEPVGDPSVYGDDRLFVTLGPVAAADALADAGHPVLALPFLHGTDLGAEVVRWEIATALCGALLGVNPFDQPDVAAAKQATAEALAARPVKVEEESPEPLLASLRPGDHLAIQAFVDPASPVVTELERGRAALRDRYRVATTLGVGPRYLHSTGQYHKGGPDTGVFLQIVSDDGEDIDVPGERYGFGRLKHAQAAGDLAALRALGRRVVRTSADAVLAAAR